MRQIWIAVFTGSLLALFGQSAPTGGISGVVAGDDGKPLAANVTANAVGAAASGRASSASDGTFAIPGLAAGDYFLCAHPTASGYLDPCAWAPLPMKVTVATGKVTAGTRVVLAKGVVVKVRLDDTSNLLGAPAVAGKTVPHALVGFFSTRGLFESLRVTGKDASGTDREGTVPANQAVRLHVTGNGVVITDTGGKNVAASAAPITVTQNAASPSPVIVLKVVKP